MTIITSLQAEKYKQQRRANWLFLLIPLAVELLVMGAGFDTDRLSDGWMMLFYYMPLANAMCLPVVIALYASRIADLEHQGRFLKTLYTVMPQRRVFFTKLLYGLGGVAAMCLAQTALLLLLAVRGGYGPTPVGDLLFWTLNTFLAAGVLYWLQMILAYFIVNQAVAICTGVVGSMAGLFLLFISRSPLLRIVPWSLPSAGMFIQMDYNTATEEQIFSHLPYSGAALTACLLWLAALLVVSRLLLSRADTEKDGSRARKGAGIGRDTFHRRPVGWLKLKGSPAWIALILLPPVSASIGTFNYQMNLSVLQDGWYSLWSQHTLFLSFLFLPVAIGIFASAAWRLEHSGANWNLAGVLVKPGRLLREKYAATLYVTWVALLWMLILYLAAGQSVGIKGTLPGELAEWVLLGMVGAAAICAVQTFLSLAIHNFMLPVGISAIGGFLGLMATAKHMPYLLPWSLMSMGMRANNPHFELDYGRFFLGVAVNILLWLAAAYFWLKKRDTLTNG